MSSVNFYFILFEWLMQVIPFTKLKMANPCDREASVCVAFLFEDWCLIFVALLTGSVDFISLGIKQEFAMPHKFGNCTVLVCSCKLTAASNVLKLCFLSNDLIFIHFFVI